MTTTDPESIPEFRRDYEGRRLHLPVVEKAKSLLTALPVVLAVIFLGLILLDEDRTISFFAFLVGAVITGAMITRSIKIWSLAVNGLLAKADVKDVQEYSAGDSPDPMEAGSHHRMKYTLEYADTRGRKHTITYTERARSKPRDDFEVLYDPRRPKKALVTKGLPKFRVDGSGEVRLTSNLAALIGVIISVAIICAWAYFCLGRAT